MKELLKKGIRITALSLGLTVIVLGMIWIYQSSAYASEYNRKIEENNDTKTYSNQVALKNASETEEVTENVSEVVETEATTEEATIPETEPQTETSTQAPTQKQTQAPTTAAKETTTQQPVQQEIQEPVVQQVVNEISTYDYANEVLRLVNEIRTANGVQALTYSVLLEQVAFGRNSEHIAQGIISHNRPNGSKWSTILAEYNFSAPTVGENLAMYTQTPQETVDAWMASPTHKALILDSRFTKMGVAASIIEENYWLCWTQIFAQ